MSMVKVSLEDFLSKLTNNGTAFARRWYNHEELSSNVMCE